MIQAATITHGMFSMGLESDPLEAALARLRRGDTEALSVLLPTYQRRLFRFLLRLSGNAAMAEDLFQLTWVRVMERIDRYDSRARFDSWLFTVARNLAIDHLRRKGGIGRGISPGISLDEEDERGGAPIDRLPETGLDPLAQLLRSERAARVLDAMRDLAPIHREVLTLRFEEDMKLEEIAEVAGIPLATVKSRLHRALAHLRTVLIASSGGAA